MSTYRSEGFWPPTTRDGQGGDVCRRSPRATHEEIETKNQKDLAPRVKRNRRFILRTKPTGHHDADRVISTRISSSSRENLQKLRLCGHIIERNGTQKPIIHVSTPHVESKFGNFPGFRTLRHQKDSQVTSSNRRRSFAPRRIEELRRKAQMSEKFLAASVQPGSVGRKDPGSGQWCPYVYF